VTSGDCCGPALGIAVFREIDVENQSPSLSHLSAASRAASPARGLWHSCRSSSIEEAAPATKGRWSPISRPRGVPPKSICGSRRPWYMPGRRLARGRMIRESRLARLSAQVERAASARPALAAYRRPVLTAALLIVITALATVSSSRLRIQLRSDRAPAKSFRSIQDLDKLTQRFGGAGWVIVVGRDAEPAEGSGASRRARAQARGAAPGEATSTTSGRRSSSRSVPSISRPPDLETLPRPALRAHRLGEEDAQPSLPRPRGERAAAARPRRPEGEVRRRRGDSDAFWLAKQLASPTTSTKSNASSRSWPSRRAPRLI